MWGDSMDLIQKVGGQGIAEIIVSQVMTNACFPNCYFPDKKVYGYADAEGHQVYFFDEESNQYLNCQDASESFGECVLLIDLKVELLDMEVMGARA